MDKGKGSLHALDMAYISRDGTIADDSIGVLIRTWDINGRFITTRVTEIPVFLVQLFCYFFNCFHCTIIKFLNLLKTFTD